MNLQQRAFRYHTARHAIVLSFAWLMISWTGCGPGGGGAAKVFTSPDGRISITAPADWEKHTFKNKLVKIGIHNRARDGWGEVLIQRKSHLKDKPTLSVYADVNRKKVADKAANPTRNIENRTMSEFTSLTINGYPAMRYEMKGTVQNTKFVYIQTFVETPDFFVQLTLWTSDLAGNQADFDSIAGSLKQIK
jgi:hypothetical protein